MNAKSYFQPGVGLPAALSRALLVLHGNRGSEAMGFIISPRPAAPGLCLYVKVTPKLSGLKQQQSFYYLLQAMDLWLRN